MLDLFKNRNLMYSNALRVTDYIGKSIRENTTIYRYNDTTNRIHILTESDHIIEGDLKFGESKITLAKIKVYSADDYLSDDKFDETISESAQSLISNIGDKMFSQAENSFDNIISLFEDKVNLKKHRNLLESKRRSVANRNVLDTEVWTKLIECRKNLVSFLKENLSTVSNNSDLVNSILLSRVVSAAINVPVLTLETFSKRKRYSIPLNHKDSIYELICQRELIQKELLEAKNTFSTIWTNSEAMRNLALGFNAKDKTDLVSEAIKDVPMFSLATKQQIASIFEKVHTVYNNAISISEAKFNDHVSKVYETKKPYKSQVIKILNEQYGVSVQNLRHKPSFDSLSKINSSTMEILSKVAKKDYPALSEILSEASKLLKTKTGFSALYFSDYLNEAFTKSGLLSEMPVAAGEMKELNLDKIKAELMRIRDAIAMSRGKSEQPSGEMGAEMEPEMGGEDGMEGEAPGEFGGEEGSEQELGAEETDPRDEMSDQDDQYKQPEGDIGPPKDETEANMDQKVGQNNSDLPYDETEMTQGPAPGSEEDPQMGGTDPGLEGEEEGFEEPGMEAPTPGMEGEEEPGMEGEESGLDPEGGLMAGEVSAEDEVLDLAREIEELLSGEGEETEAETGEKPFNGMDEEEDM